MSAPDRDRARPVVGDAMLHPAILGALALLIANDHVLKAASAGTAWTVVTGKLSDAAGMTFFPALLWSLYEVVTRRAPASERVVVVAAALTGAVFALTKTFDAAAHGYRVAIAALQWPVYAVAAVAGGRDVPALHAVQHVMDATDLVCVPFVALAVLVGIRRARVVASRP